MALRASLPRLSRVLRARPALSWLEDSRPGGAQSVRGFSCATSDDQNTGVRAAGLEGGGADEGREGEAGAASWAELLAKYVDRQRHSTEAMPSTAESELSENERHQPGPSVEQPSATSLEENSTVSRVERLDFDETSLPRTSAVEEEGMGKPLYHASRGREVDSRAMTRGVAHEYVVSGDESGELRVDTEIMQHIELIGQGPKLQRMNEAFVEEEDEQYEEPELPEGPSASEDTIWAEEEPILADLDSQDIARVAGGAELDCDFHKEPVRWPVGSKADYGLFLKDIPEGTTPSDLREAFQDHGGFLAASVKPATHRTKAFAFAFFQGRKSLERALEKQTVMVKGQPVLLQLTHGTARLLRQQPSTNPPHPESSGPLGPSKFDTTVFRIGSGSPASSLRGPQAGTGWRISVYGIAASVPLSEIRRALSEFGTCSITLHAPSPFRSRFKVTVEFTTKEAYDAALAARWIFFSGRKATMHPERSISSSVPVLRLTKLDEESGLSFHELRDACVQLLPVTRLEMRTASIVDVFFDVAIEEQKITAKLQNVELSGWSWHMTERIPRYRPVRVGQFRLHGGLSQLLARKNDSLRNLVQHCLVQLEDVKEIQSALADQSQTG